ncbi:MAG: hypothetical protein AB7K52_06460 [Phycisphaerales bacterium]
MLLTLAATSLASKLKPAKGSGASGSPKGSLTIFDIPKFAREQLDLHGMVLSTSLLQGADRAFLQKIVENADKVGCPCLTLIESTPQPVGDPDKAGPAADRILRVVQAAHWLGCNAVAIPVDCPDDDDAMSDAAEVLRPILRKAEKMELNLCIASGASGLTARPERVTDLLKKVGGFRIGTLPDFDSASRMSGKPDSPAPAAKGKAAAAANDASSYLRRLVPYASTVLAVVREFEPGKGKNAAPAHKPYDLLDCVRTVAAVGFDGSLAIDWRGPASQDPIENIVAARDAIRSIIGGGTIVDEDDLDELAGVEADVDSDDEKDPKTDREDEA